MIKNEFFPKKVYQNHKEAKKIITKIISVYNNTRPHSSLDFLTPEQAHKKNGVIMNRWKHYANEQKPREQQPA